jgi:hypothetical protein
MRKYESKPHFGSIKTIVTPGAVILITPVNCCLKAGEIALLCLDFPDEVCFTHFAGLNAHFFGNFFDFLHIHGGLQIGGVKGY